MLQTNNSMHSAGNASASFAAAKRMSPRNAGATLRQNGAKIAISPEDSVRGHVKRIEDWIGAGQQTLREYKKEIEMLR
eukprot:CAMPEP_0170452516 /NCGR_PEP_ID=MMETSP0123-20130129/1385_1 /TAXON_ID=182087 /ORGANISM="Favella ehrenbergii, Strain Fehren 1" /LENGTH=77 /DNA_ID=CAMNT_0010714541 /DNA_START=1 /DNA_END=234 /DNA_ORIENTATION=+